MLRRLLPTLRIRSLVVQKQPTRNDSTYFMTKKYTPVIPACFWATLSNGVRVVTEQTADPLACVTIIFEAGSRFETKCNNGACHFFELMAFRGLCSLTGLLFQERIREMGAYMTAHTDREYQAFTCTCPHQCVNEIICLFGRILCEIGLDCRQMEYAKVDVYNLLQQLDTDYKKLCFDYLHQTAFQGTPLGFSPIGPWDNYRSFDRCFLAAFICQHYQPFRLVLSVSSKFSHAEVTCTAQSAFGNMRPTTNKLVNWPCRFTGSMVKYRDDRMPFCHIAIAVECCGHNSKDYYGVQLLKHLVGRWDESQCQGYGTWPLIAHASTLSKLCYHYEAFYIPYCDVGLFGVYFVIKKEDDFEDAILMIQDQWMRLCTTLTHTDVERAAASLKLELAKAVDGCRATCLEMGLQIMYHGTRRDLMDLYGIVENTKQYELKNLADALIYDREVAVAGVGPTEGIPDYNRLRAGMYWLRL